MIRSLLRLLPAVALLCTSIALIGCESDGATSQPTTMTTMANASMGAINDACPISGEALGDDATLLDFEGAKVGICCGGCKGKWETWSYARKRNFVASSK